MSTKYVFILGRQQDLCAAEVEAALKIYKISREVVLNKAGVLIIQTEQTLPENFLDRLGGTDRLGIVVAEHNKPWTAENLAELFKDQTGKMNIGLSAISISQNLPTLPLKQLANDLKKILREQNIRLRFVLPNSRNLINAAQSIFNKLTTKPNREFILLATENSYFTVDVLDVQDIQAYELRDTSRPARDAYVGMLPPKLAQMMLNLALGNITTPLSILDPFCGLGTILQEGWLMDYKMYGADSNEEMITSSKKNLDYLQERFKVNAALSPTLKQHDARHAFPDEWRNMFDAIVTEPYLGKPLLTPPSEREIEASVDMLSALYVDFFKAAQTVLKPQGVILFALPAFRTPEGSKAHYTLFPETFIDQIQEIGYRRIQLIPPEKGEAVYARPDAIVGRELTLWQKL